MQVFSYILLIGAVQGLVLSLALWRKPGNHISNRLLSVWLLMLVFDLLMKVIYLHDKNTPFLSFYVLIQFFPFFYGSFFFLYIRTLVQRKPVRWVDAVHFMGFVLMLVLNMPWILNPQGPPTIFYRFYEPLLYLYSVSYVIVGVILVHQYRRQTKAQLSDLTGVDLIWLMVMAYGQIVIWGVAVSQWLSPVVWFDFWYIYIVISLWIILVGYLALNQNPITALEPLKASFDDEDDERFNQVKNKLTVLMEEGRMYLQPSLTIKQLAQKSGYPEYLISLFLNRVYEQTFHLYINSQRIEHAKQLLSDAVKHDTILDVAYASGFTAKSTFNTAFKQFVGLTPSDFRRQSSLSVAVKTTSIHK